MRGDQEDRRNVGDGGRGDEETLLGLSLSLAFSFAAGNDSIRSALYRAMVPFPPLAMERIGGIEPDSCCLGPVPPALSSGVRFLAT